MTRRHVQSDAWLVLQHAFRQARVDYYRMWEDPLTDELVVEAGWYGTLRVPLRIQRRAAQLGDMRVFADAIVRQVETLRMQRVVAPEPEVPAELALGVWPNPCAHSESDLLEAMGVVDAYAIHEIGVFL